VRGTFVPGGFTLFYDTPDQRASDRLPAHRVSRRARVGRRSGIIDAMVRRALLLLALVPAVVHSDAPRHFSLLASFVPAEKPGGVAHVAVRFRALDPDLRLNVSPAPRLTLDIAQRVLVDQQPPASRVHSGSEPADYDPLTARYRDLAMPVSFPVAFAPAAPKGEQSVKARVVFFYCSEREAWCRRGVTEIEIPVVVP
jgi:hypothetical protein